MRAAGAVFLKYAQAPQNRGSHGGVLSLDDGMMSLIFVFLMAIVTLYLITHFGRTIHDSIEDDNDCHFQQVTWKKRQRKVKKKRSRKMCRNGDRGNR
jgi:hypothetical protein